MAEEKIREEIWFCWRMDQKKDQPANGQTDQQTNQPNNEPLDGVGASWLPTSAPHAKEQVRGAHLRQIRIFSTASGALVVGGVRDI